MMGSITGHTGTENQYRPLALNGCIWLSDAGLWLLQESDLGGLLCGKVRPHYCCLYDQRPWPSRWSSCLTDFQQVKWTSWRSTSGLRTTAVAQLAVADCQQTATSHWDRPMFQTMWSRIYQWMFHFYQLQVTNSALLCQSRQMLNKAQSECIGTHFLVVLHPNIGFRLGLQLISNLSFFKCMSNGHCQFPEPNVAFLNSFFSNQQFNIQRYWIYNYTPLRKATLHICHI